MPGKILRPVYYVRTFRHSRPFLCTVSFRELRRCLRSRSCFYEPSAGVGLGRRVTPFFWWRSSARQIEIAFAQCSAIFFSLLQCRSLPARTIVFLSIGANPLFSLTIESTPYTPACRLTIFLQTRQDSVHIGISAQSPVIPRGTREKDWWLSAL